MKSFKINCNINYIMKFLSVLGISLLLTVLVGSVIRNITIKGNKQLVSPLVAGEKGSFDQSVFNDSGSDLYPDWQVFFNNYNGYKIKYPENVSIRNMQNGDIAFQKNKSINILIVQDVLNENNSLDTLIKKEIDDKRNKLSDKFSLINTISPIALGSVTAQTFTSNENGLSVSYYYVPQNDKKYLKITDNTPNMGDENYLISEKIIYSINLLP